MRRKLFFTKKVRQYLSVRGYEFDPYKGGFLTRCQFTEGQIRQMIRNRKLKYADGLLFLEHRNDMNESIEGFMIFD